MKITTTIIENENYSQIFVVASELEKEEIKNEIEKQKKKESYMMNFWQKQKKEKIKKMMMQGRANKIFIKPCKIRQTVIKYKT